MDSIEFTEKGVTITDFSDLCETVSNGEIVVSDTEDRSHVRD